MRKFFGVILSIALVMPLILAALMTFSITNWALDKNLYPESCFPGGLNMENLFSKNA